jgi:hypothetical protein
MRKLRAATRLGLCVATALLVPALLGCTADDQGGSGGSVQQRLQRIADEAWGQLSARYPDAARPDAEFVRIVTDEEWAPAIAGCMNELGFPDVEAMDDGSVVSGEVSASQRQAYDFASYECNVRYPVDPKFSEPLTNEQIDNLYAYYKDTLAPCLEDQGYQISPAPSLQTFRQTYNSGPWLPYAEVVASVTPDELQDLYDVCPDVPSNFWD